MSDQSWSLPYPLHIFILALFVLAATASQFMTGLATGSFESIPLTGPRSWGAIIANIFMLQGLAAGQVFCYATGNTARARRLNCA